MFRSNPIISLWINKLVINGLYPKRLINHLFRIENLLFIFDQLNFNNYNWNRIILLYPNGFEAHQTIKSYSSQ